MFVTAAAGGIHTQRTAHDLFLFLSGAYPHINMLLRTTRPHLVMMFSFACK